MIKVLVKIFIAVAINFFLVKSLYLDEVNKLSNSRSYIKQVYSYEGFKYWSKEDGYKFCGPHTDEERQKAYTELDKYANWKTNIIYFQNVDLAACKDEIPEIAREIHKRNISFAINIEKTFDHKEVFVDENFSKLKPDYYKNKFKEFEFVNQWVDYLIFDHAMEYLTFNERRQVQTDLRHVFKKNFIGFRFTRHIDGFPTDNHPNRQDMILEEFLPKDDDGDFIITSIYVPTFKRTLIFAEDVNANLATVNGEFILE